jgi:hypothetical protein
MNKLITTIIICLTIITTISAINVFSVTQDYSYYGSYLTHDLAIVNNLDRNVLANLDIRITNSEKDIFCNDFVYPESNFERLRWISDDVITPAGTFTFKCKNDSGSVIFTDTHKYIANGNYQFVFIAFPMLNTTNLDKYQIRSYITEKENNPFLLRR